MPRALRENLRDAAYHVYARGNDKGLVFRDDTDRHVYLRGLRDLVHRYEIRCLSYCLMSNHMHLLLETPHANLSPGMQWFHGGYAQAFNRRHGRSGHLFQGRYGASRIKFDAQFAAAARYVARNPVDAALCDAPGEWRWSSYAATIERREPDWLAGDRLLSLMGGRERFEALIDWTPAVIV